MGEPTTITKQLRRVSWQGATRDHYLDPTDSSLLKGQKVLCGQLTDGDWSTRYDLPDRCQDCATCKRIAGKRWADGYWLVEVVRERSKLPTMQEYIEQAEARDGHRETWWCEGACRAIAPPPWDDRDWRSLYFACPICGVIRLRFLFDVTYRMVKRTGRWQQKRYWEGRIATHAAGQGYKSSFYIKGYYQLTTSGEWQYVRERTRIGGCLAA